ncbi:MAG: glycosyltransferase family 2 protein [Lachnospiraceae bacterium]|nr:glycosyltransferase family 2 protein [Lachnospiraceae bacterium]
MKDSISVIIPCYNEEKHLERCLTSIIKQSTGLKYSFDGTDRDKIEIICVDDASTDGTTAILKDWEKKYPENIRVIINERNNRQGAARNIGMQYASCEWISFVDADDWLEPDFFEKLIKKSHDNTYDIVACNYAEDTSAELTYFEAGDTDEKGKDVFVTDDMVRKEVFREQCFGKVYPSIVKRHFLTGHRITFPERLMYEDIYYKELLHMEISRGVVINEKLYHFYVRPEEEKRVSDVMSYADYLTIMMLLWKEWGRRGYFSKYENELTAEFLKVGYIGFLRMLFSRKDVLPYTYFLLIKELVLTLTPAADKKHYLKNSPYFTDFQKLWLSALWRDVDRDDFDKIVEATIEAGGI